MLIDFHSHYYEANWFSAQPQGQNVFTRAWPLLSNIEAQLAAMDAAGIDAKVLSAPAAPLLAPGEPPPIALMQRINERMAELVATYPKRLLALATIDAFGGDAAAREVERAVRELVSVVAQWDAGRIARFEYSAAHDWRGVLPICR